ncbi:MAG: ABC-2 type transport system ATP-binding protein [Hyphomicrobiaceae bacterium]
MTAIDASAVRVSDLSFSYGEHRALDRVSFQVEQGVIFGLLGPNGGGKTTLFRLLSTLLPAPAGTISIEGFDPAQQTAAVRVAIGVVFQSPSLDNKLTVVENLRHHGHLYGLRGGELDSRITRRLGDLRLTDRSNDIVETLSGGLKRRVELAKGLLSNPKVLILDEPSTGLDPRARRDFWAQIEILRKEQGTTVLVTTHLTDEAERCDRLAFLDRGRIVSQGSPDELRRRIGGDVITIHTASPAELEVTLQRDMGVQVTRIGDALRIEHDDGASLVHRLYADFGTRFDSISIGRPTLEDVFIHETGRSLSLETEGDPS